MIPIGGLYIDIEFEAEEGIEYYSVRNTFGDILFVSWDRADAEAWMEAH